MATDLDALLTALKSDPVARDAIRREVLTEDLLDLPGQVERLAAHTDARFAELAAALAHLTERVDKLAEAQGRTEENLAAIGAKPEWGTLSRLAGTDYESYALDPPRAVARAVGATPGRLRHVSGGDLEVILNEAEATGRLAPEEADEIAADLRDANGLFVWDRSPESPPLYCVVEASITAQAKDVKRAIARAERLRRAGVEAHPVVISETVGPDAAEAVQLGRVAWRRVPQRPVRGRPLQFP